MGGIVIIFLIVLSFCLGILVTNIYYIHKKPDGRLVIDDDSYFVAITSKPEDLSKKKKLILKVFTK